MAGQNATTPRWLSASEMKAWRRYIIASRRLLEALDFDIAHHELSMADYEVLAQLSDPRTQDAYERISRRCNDFSLAPFPSHQGDGEGRLGKARTMSYR